MSASKGLQAMIGHTLGDYRILDKLGAGGMGEVYRAHHVKLQRDVALKVLPAGSFSDPAARARLLREARSAARLNHPNICTIHDVGEVEGRAYIAMELVEGEPLNVRLARGSLSVEQTTRYALQLADALAHAHERGIVHRDLKSANVIITDDGRAKVLDFGLARQMRDSEINEATKSHETLTAPGTVMGTLAYMAPEQLRAETADERSDIWALGVVVFEMVAGDRPFCGNTGFEVSSAILYRAPRPLPKHVPMVLQAVVARCLEKEPGRRYQRASEVRAALEALPMVMMAAWMNWRFLSGRRAWLALIGAAVIVAALLTIFDAGGLRTRLVGVPAIESLAVLPLEDLSGDPGQAYFAAGMTETLITDLARLGALKRVIARGSVMRYQGTKLSFAEIARELDVDRIVTGSVMRSRELVSVTVQLIDPLSGHQIWANRYERDLKDVIRLQNDIVSAIVSGIQLQLSPRERARLVEARTVNPEAYEAYLRGRFEADRLSPRNLEMAEEYFRLASQKDPGFALAHVGIARVWLIRGHLGYVPPRDAIPEVRAAVSKALKLDEREAMAYYILGSSQFYLEWDWEAARQSWKRAEELDPNISEARVGRAAFSAAMGQLEGSGAAFEQALESDPHNPQLRDWYGHQLLRLRRYDDAIAQFRRVLSAEPGFRSWGGLWCAYHLQQKHGEAVTYAAQYFSTGRYSEVGNRLVQDFAARGYAAAMLRAAATLAERSALPLMIARTYAFAGELNLAQEWLEKAYQNGDSSLVYLKVDPTFDILRGDPRFQALLKRMNFPP